MDLQSSAETVIFEACLSEKCHWCKHFTVHGSIMNKRTIKGACLCSCRTTVSTPLVKHNQPDVTCVELERTADGQKNMEITIMPTKQRWIQICSSLYTLLYLLYFRTSSNFQRPQHFFQTFRRHEQMCQTLNVCKENRCWNAARQKLSLIESDCSGRTWTVSAYSILMTLFNGYQLF